MLKRQWSWPVTVLHPFYDAILIHGLPLRVWGDFGVENVDATQYMLNDPERAINRGSFITRTSVHNQPVKHVWGDVD